MKIVCAICDKQIEDDETVAVFHSCGVAIYTHASESEYDCDYRYMLTEMMPDFRIKSEIEPDE